MKYTLCTLGIIILDTLSTGCALMGWTGAAFILFGLGIIPKLYLVIEGFKTLHRLMKRRK